MRQEAGQSLDAFTITCCLCGIPLVNAVGEVPKQPYIIALCEDCHQEKDFVMCPTRSAAKRDYDFQEIIKTLKK